MNWADWKNFTFANPGALWLLLAWPALALWRSRRGAAAAVKFSSLRPLAGLGVPRRAARWGFWFGLPLLALSILTLALARPQLTQTTSRTNASGIDIMLALDVSRSMLAEDINIGQDLANRIETSKKVTHDFIEARPNDRIGMLAFAGRPYLVSPLTLDHDWLFKNLERVRIGLVEDGTAIGLAVASAANRLKDRTDSKSRIVVLLTDGINNSGNVTPTTAAEAAAALGIKVYTIGVGSEKEARIPVNFNGQIVYRWIEVDVDEPGLKKIAQLTGGEYYRATDGKSLQRIFATIDKLEKTTVETTETKQYRDLFPWFIGAGTLLALLHVTLELAWPRRLP